MVLTFNNFPYIIVLKLIHLNFMKNTTKILKIFGLLFISALIFSMQADFAFAAPNCVGKAMTFEEYKWFKAHGQVSTTLSVNDEAGKAVAHINNNTDCSMPVGLDTFQMYDNILQNQTKFDGVHIVIPPHTQGFKLKANIPACMVQIDTYVGAGWETPNNLTAWLIANQVSGTGLHDVSGNYCTRQPPLVVSCSSNPSSVSQNGVITWSVSASGGNGNFLYSWSGTDGLSGTSQVVNKAYPLTGTKNALVTVTSGDKTKSASCSAVVSEGVTPLVVSCSPSSSSIRKNSSVYWNSTVTGGKGSYLYSWSGTDGLSGSGSNVYKSYSYTGTKTATVTVYSETQSVSATCDLNVYDDYIPTSYLEGSCSASPYNAQVGTNVSWNASAYGGSGSYYYYWTGTDGLYGNGQYISKSYYSPGYKTATVTISSGGQSITRTCNTNVGQVLAYTETNNLPTLNSVYLSQVPYTGIEDNLHTY